MSSFSYVLLPKTPKPHRGKFINSLLVFENSLLDLVSYSLLLLDCVEHAPGHNSFVV